MLIISQLSAYYSGIIVVPTSLSNSCPNSTVAKFNSSFTATITINQPYTAFIAICVNYIITAQGIISIPDIRRYKNLAYKSGTQPVRWLENMMACHKLLCIMVMYTYFTKSEYAIG